MKKIMTAFVSVLRLLKENKQGFIVMKHLPILWLALLLGISHNTLAGTELYFVHNDHLGTARVITNQNQNVVWQGEYSPFGEVEETSDQLEFRQRFPGQYSDDESEYFYNYYRDYDPSIGRYIQSDPIGLQGGFNTYAYVSGNPLKYIDPFGLVKKCITVLRLPGVDIQACSEDGKHDETCNTEQEAKNAKRMSTKELNKAAKKNGYKDAHDLKRDYHMDSNSDIFVDKHGNMYEGPRQGTGTPQPLGINKHGI